ncbi:MAG: hypothetical protein U1E76_04530 [Planctomycetota bacterium]
MNGDSALDYFGWSVGGAGDANGDGFAEFQVVPTGMTGRATGRAA